MKTREEIIEEMMVGLQSLDEYWANRKLKFSHAIRVNLYVALLVFLKYTYRPIRRIFKGKFDVTDGLDKHSGLSLQNRGTKRQETDGENYLTEAEVKEFEHSGILGPFKVPLTLFSTSKTSR